ncbi:probable F420-dependent oxidoreductase, MSMEG_4141 family [Amycolatopsis marina]|uniref:Probable F420-dependent oxidoreductase, MSMEG_4141 family n=1 Tax=Amycolatopsis marina TaxID=490629 RepID=A0A1I1BVB0_9PSEU|nr:TIGR03620 family F420-dependent LLM class oxidoreductase [Amycolatopsis marina]SFB52598.1 probable F420-dependent oxidoreductase, MSMEG_4141 family [Amycolatopsis marina]
MPDPQHRPGKIGIWTFAFDAHPAGRVRDAAAELEELGYRAIWFGEALGREAMTQAALLLGATHRAVVATGIANVHLRTPLTMAAAERSLAEQYRGRLLLGLGGHRVPGSPNSFGGYRVPMSEKPVSDMRDYLDTMDTAPLAGATPATAPRRVLAALGPRMLDLAAERTSGAHSYFVPVAHTAMARERMGTGAYLAVEQAVVLDSDPERVRQLQRAHVGAYLRAQHQRNNLLRLGFDETELADGGSGRLNDALVAGGDIKAISARVRAHLDAGADHVCLQVLTPSPGELPLREWRELAALVGEH